MFSTSKREWDGLSLFARRPIPDFGMGIVAEAAAGHDVLLDAISTAFGFFFHTATRRTGDRRRGPFGRPSPATPDAAVTSFDMGRALERLYAAVPDGLIVLTNSP